MGKEITQKQVVDTIINIINIILLCTGFLHTIIGFIIVMAAINGILKIEINNTIIWPPDQHASN